MKKLAKIFKIAMYISLTLLVLSIGIVVLFRWVNPKVTPLMLLRTAQKYSCNRTSLFRRKWTKLSDISPDMVHAVIVAEDSKFYKHLGFDFEAMREAYERNLTEQRIRGGSTISQQTAKNVFLLPHRSYVRKALEAYFTLLIEVFWGKQRIMEVYLNVIETGKCMYGIEEAAQAYYKKPASQLNRAEAATIAALLPRPLKRSPNAPSEYLLERSSAIEARIDSFFPAPSAQ